MLRRVTHPSARRCPPALECLPTRRQIICLSIESCPSEAAYLVNWRPLPRQRSVQCDQQPARTPRDAARPGPSSGSGLGSAARHQPRTHAVGDRRAVDAALAIDDAPTRPSGLGSGVRKHCCTCGRARDVGRDSGGCGVRGRDSIAVTQKPRSMIRCMDIALTGASIAVGKTRVSNCHAATALG